jgi:hypothetical protein
LQILSEALSVLGQLWIVGAALVVGWHDHTGDALMLVGAIGTGMGGLLRIALYLAARRRGPDRT